MADAIIGLRRRDNITKCYHHIADLASSMLARLQKTWLDGKARVPPKPEPRTDETPQDRSPQSMEHMRLQANLLLLPGEIRNNIYDAMNIPEASSSLSSFLSIPHPWMRGRSYFPGQATISPPIPAEFKDIEIPCLGDNTELWGEYITRSITECSKNAVFTIEGRFNLDLASHRHRTDARKHFHDFDKFQESATREATLLKRCIDEKIMPTLVWKENLEADAAPLPQLGNRTTVLSDLEHWLPTMQNCQLILRLSGEALELLSEQPNFFMVKAPPAGTVYDHDPVVAQQAADDIKALIESVASMFRYSTELKTLRIKLKFMGHMSRGHMLPKVRLDIFDEWFEPFTKIKTKEGVWLECRGGGVQGTNGYGSVEMGNQTFGPYLSS